MLSAHLRRVDPYPRAAFGQDGKSCAVLVESPNPQLIFWFTQTLQSSFKRYPELKERFNQVVIMFFKDAMVPTCKLVSDMVA